MTLDDIEAFLGEHGAALSKGAEELREEIRRSMIDRRRHDVILRVLEANPSADATRIPMVVQQALAAADVLYPLPLTPEQQQRLPRAETPDAG